ncbi:hypothetical protein [Herbiconiux daphne]|uniref:Uncharacterized protein n=1 Tax=Herbiconiux daphne TaxID=2970914 RepID=A0ABT2H1Y9_9MICO|nr:hypothetical protein [Herbiconiux daphne]MCS5733925.1 hypothetical protein [Herbiconiux daphne]
MNEKRKWKPIWRWETFQLAMVLLLAIVANVVTRADWPVVGPVLAIVLLVLAVGFALLLIVPLFLPSGRDSENSRRSLDGVALVPAADAGRGPDDTGTDDTGTDRTSTGTGRTTTNDVTNDTPTAEVLVPVDETRRHQTSIDAAQAKTVGGLTAVLTPDASRWLGRELRVAVDLVAGDGRLYRAGFLPRDFGAALDPELQRLAKQRAAVQAPVTVEGAAPRFTVKIALPPLRRARSEQPG